METAIFWKKNLKSGRRKNLFFNHKSHIVQHSETSSLLLTRPEGAADQIQILASILSQGHCHGKVLLSCEDFLMTKISRPHNLVFRNNPETDWKFPFCFCWGTYRLAFRLPATLPAWPVASHFLLLWTEDYDPKFPQETHRPIQLYHHLLTRWLLLFLDITPLQKLLAAIRAQCPKCWRSLHQQHGCGLSPTCSKCKCGY